MGKFKNFPAKRRYHEKHHSASLLVKAFCAILTEQRHQENIRKKSGKNQEKIRKKSGKSQEKSGKYQGRGGWGGEGGDSSIFRITG